MTDALGNQHLDARRSRSTLKDGLPTTTIACDGGRLPGRASSRAGAGHARRDRRRGGRGLDALHDRRHGPGPEQPPQYTAPFTLTDTTTVKFRSYDSHGNAEPVHSQTIKIDATAPTAQITSPLDGATVSGRRERQGRRGRHGLRHRERRAVRRRRLPRLLEVEGSPVRVHSARGHASRSATTSSRRSHGRARQPHDLEHRHRQGRDPTGGPTTTIACDGARLPGRLRQGPGRRSRSPRSTAETASTRRTTRPTARTRARAAPRTRLRSRSRTRRP